MFPARLKRKGREWEKRRRRGERLEEAKSFFFESVKI
jgi:hypothetical protein